MDSAPTPKPTSNLSWPAIAIIVAVFVLMAAARILWAFSLYYEIIPLGILALIFVGVRVFRRKS